MCISKHFMDLVTLICPDFLKKATKANRICTLMKKTKMIHYVTSFQLPVFHITSGKKNTINPFLMPYFMKYTYSDLTECYYFKWKMADTGPALWHSGLNCCLQHWHPLWVVVRLECSTFNLAPCLWVWESSRRWPMFGFLPCTQETHMKYMAHVLSMTQS